eukprot:2570099-Rhodomonas_salina.5
MHSASMGKLHSARGTSVVPLLIPSRKTFGSMVSLTSAGQFEMLSGLPESTQAPGSLGSIVAWWTWALMLHVPYSWSVKSEMGSQGETDTMYASAILFNSC